MEIHFSRSRTLNNIPATKVQAKIADLLSGCATCSKRETGVDGIDGACSNCAVAIVAYNRYAESNIPLQYWHLKMEKDFTGDPRLLVKYNEIVDNVKQVYLEGRSICFAGRHGVGKTFVSACILKKAAQHGYSCLYSTLSDIVGTLTQSDDKFAARRELTMVDFLTLDEFDPRFFSSESAADLYARTLEGVFRTRAQNKLPTFMCSNSPNVVESFSGPLKQSIESLFKGYMETFVVLGDDHRGKAK